MRIADAGRLFPAVCRAHRVARKDVLDVHQGKLLMLLFVMQAELDQVFELRKRIVPGVVQQRFHRRVDMGAIGHHVVQRRPGQQTAIGARMTRADGFVVGIEQVIVVGMEFRVARCVRFQHEGFEKPGDMREMPFRRTDIWHRLNLLVFGGQPFRDGFGLGADGLEAHRKGCATVGFGAASGGGICRHVGFRGRCARGSGPGTAPAPLRADTAYPLRGHDLHTALWIRFTLVRTTNGNNRFCVARGYAVVSTWSPGPDGAGPALAIPTLAGRNSRSWIT